MLPLLIPDIPPSWSQAIAAVGAILVVVLLLRFMTDVLRGQGHQSATLIDRSFDIADSVLAKMAPEVVETDLDGSILTSQVPPPPPPDDSPAEPPPP